MKTNKCLHCHLMDEVSFWRSVYPDVKDSFIIKSIINVVQDQCDMLGRDDLMDTLTEYFKNLSEHLDLTARGF